MARVQGLPPGAAGTPAHCDRAVIERVCLASRALGPWTEFLLGPPSSEVQLPIVRVRLRAVVCPGVFVETFLPFIPAQTTGSCPNPVCHLTEGRLGHSCTRECTSPNSASPASMEFLGTEDPELAPVQRRSKPAGG